MNEVYIEICEITTGTTSEPLTSLVTSRYEKLSQSEDGKFPCSAADISVHQKVELQDTGISEESLG